MHWKALALFYLMILTIGSLDQFSVITGDLKFCMIQMGQLRSSRLISVRLDCVELTTTYQRVVSLGNAGDRRTYLALSGKPLSVVESFGIDTVSVGFE